MNANLRSMLGGFCGALLLGAVLLAMAWGLLELAAWMWRMLHAVTPMLGVAWAWCCTALALVGMDKLASVVGW